MTEKFEIYKCNICNNIVQVLFSGVGELVCCNEKMHLLKMQNNEDIDFAEKHVPILETDVNGRFVRVPYHPMQEEHYVQMIEAYPKDKSELHIKYLRPKDVAEFNITAFAKDVDVSELCNIHGLWGNEIERKQND